MINIIKRQLTIFTIFMVAAVALSFYNMLIGFAVLFFGAIYLFFFTQDWMVANDKDLRDRVIISHLLVAFFALLWIGFSLPWAKFVALLVVLYLIFGSVFITVPTSSEDE